MYYIVKNACTKFCDMAPCHSGNIITTTTKVDRELKHQLSVES